MLNRFNAPSIRHGTATTAGVKARNDDAIAVHLTDSLRTTVKGHVVLIADGVTSAEAGRDAARLCRESFIEEFYATPDAWSTKTAARTVLTGINRDLFTRGAAFSAAERGYVCTLSIVVLKGASAHLFHIGDTRIYRIREGHIEQLTRDHRMKLNAKSSVLSRAMGLDSHAQIDYQRQEIAADDIFVLTTDGLSDFVAATDILRELEGTDDLDGACSALTRLALTNGSDDNISCAAIRIDKPGDGFWPIGEGKNPGALRFPPLLSPGDTLDGYRVVAEIHASPRSQVYKVEAPGAGNIVALKTPAPRFSDDTGYIEHFHMEAWIGKRIDHPNVIRVLSPNQPPSRLYTLTEYIEGENLARFLERRRHLEIHEVRAIVEQLVGGLRAFHRKEILHQDLKPDNLLIDANGHVKIVDFGSCRVAGIEEIFGATERDLMLGTVDYAAPEYQLHTPVGPYSDLFSLGCIAYELLTGNHPYGARYARAKTASDFNRLVYRPAYHLNKNVPLWLDGALKTAVAIDPSRRYDALSAFLKDLRTPNRRFLETTEKPLIEGNPLLFWKLLSALLFMVVLVLLFRLLTR